ncbi:hypothetical protein NDU88_006738 [Pleurodeles waltl]|uniref:Uncharacterized protein n=1 Tax=Pleurodeles waltl TaxID=8319 RepID=A0AAV7RSX8_PLEWA|nr:hypothetical protein NDU88_006738 [Pleurodeles waltl]
MSPCSSSPPSVPTSGAVGNKVVWAGSGGAPGQRPPALQSYGPQGAQEKRAPYQSSSGRLLSPCLLTVRAPAAGKHQAPPPGWEADFTPSGVPTRHSDLPLTPWTAAAVRQQAPRHDPRWATRIRRGPPPGQRPLASGPTRNRRSPPLSHRASGTSIQRGAAPPVSQAAAAPQSRSAPGTQALTPGAKPRRHRLPTSSAVVTLHFERDTARPSASRHTFEVGPSGAERLSVRHAQLRGHAPCAMLVLAKKEFTIFIWTLNGILLF